MLPKIFQNMQLFGKRFPRKVDEEFEYLNKYVSKFAKFAS